MSKGMQQRLGIAQALIGAPELLLLDEPTSALDPAGRRTVRGLLEDLRTRGVAVLLNSHLLSEIELVCDRVAIISGGRLVAEGAPHELTRARGVEIETDQRPPSLCRGHEGGRAAARRRPRPQGESVYEVKLLRTSLEESYLEVVEDERGVSPVLVIARYAIQEAVRRRVFTVVLALTAAFVALYGLAVWQVFRKIGDIHPPGGIEPKPFAGATIFGLSMFATHLPRRRARRLPDARSGAGDAERGLLQPLLVRPLGRTQLLLGRLLAAAAVCTVYVAGVYTALMLVTGLIGHWWPDRIVLPALELAVGVSIVAAISLLGSVFLSATANGIAVFMVFGSAGSSPVCSARSARSSTPGRSRRRPASSPGRSPSRRSTRTGSMRSPKTPPSPASFFGSAPSAPRTPPARGSAPGSLFTRSAFVRSR